MKKIGILIYLLFLLILSSCIQKENLGSKKNPIKIFLVPGKESSGLLHSAHQMSEFLQNETGLFFTATVPLSYIAVVEAMGTKRADIAALSTSTYLIAHKKYQAEVIFITEVNGQSTYRGQIITHVNGLKKLEDLTDKKIAYVDPASASGHLLALDLLKKRGVKPAQSIFAGGHDAVVTLVYTRKVDAGATFYSAPENGVPKDARRLIKLQYPDVFEKVTILEFTTEIPNDALAFRKDFPVVLREKVITAIQKWALSTKGKLTLKEMNNGTGLIRATDADYDLARKILNIK